jgi:imidazolonepropionase-like amidohydrolase
MSEIRKMRSQLAAISKTKNRCHCEPFFGEAISKRKKDCFVVPKNGTPRNDFPILRSLLIILVSAMVLPLIMLHVAFSSEPIPAKKQERPIVLVGGTVHTVTGPVIAEGMVLFENGRITAVGKNLSLPNNVERIEVTGKHLYPGLINAASEIGLTEIEAVRATLDLRETGMLNPNVRTEIAVNPESELIPTTRANGVAIVHLIPQGGLIAGKTSAVMLDGWTNEEMTLSAPVGMYVVWPSMTIFRSPFVRQSEEEQKKNIEKNLAVLRNAFSDARAYVQAKKADPVRHKTDVRWESMVPLFERKIPLIVSANDMKQIRSAVQFARDENLRLVIHGGRDAWRLTGLLKENNVAVIIGGTHALPSRRSDEYDAPFTLPKKLFEAGILFAIAGEGNAAMNERNLAYQAATAAAYGLPKDEALRSVTINAARIMAVDSRAGSIEPGKDATIIVTNGDPLEITTNVEMQFIRGKTIDLRSRHTQLWKKYEEKYRQLGILR